MNNAITTKKKNQLFNLTNDQLEESLVSVKKTSLLKDFFKFPACAKHTDEANLWMIH